MTGTVPEPRWRRLPEARPQQILEAALATFGERGLAAARLEDIARRAGVSKATIYLYFPNKEELFREVIRATVVAQIERAETDLAAAAGRTAWETLAQFVAGYWTFLRSRDFASLFRLVHGELGNFPDLASFYNREVVQRALRLIRGILERGVSEGEFRGIDPAVAARMLTPLLIIHALWRNHSDVCTVTAQHTDEQVLNEILDFYRTAITAGAPPPGASPSASA